MGPLVKGITAANTGSLEFDSPPVPTHRHRNRIDIHKNMRIMDYTAV